MLDPWIIEEIRREEDARQRREDRQQPVIELPLYEMPSAGEAKPAGGDTSDSPPRGVEIVDFKIF